MEPDLKALFTILIEGQIRTDKSVGELASAVGSHVELTDSRARRIEDAHVELVKAQASTELAIANLAVTVDRYVASGKQ
jgi:hypothetical protein